MRLNPDGSCFIDGIRLTATQIAEIKEAKPARRMGWWVEHRKTGEQIAYLGTALTVRDGSAHDVVNDRWISTCGQPYVICWAAH